MSVAAEPTRPSTSSGCLLAQAESALAPVSDTPRLDAELLLAACAGLGRAFLRAFPERIVGAPAKAAFEDMIRRRLTGFPVAYLLGHQEFYSLELSVNPAVLIPRPETELLVERAVSALLPLESPRVLDLGTGSGAIAIALKLHCPAAELTALDISEAALEVAKANARRHRATIRWLLSDWFSALEPGERFDLVVANPPYVAEADPHLAALAHEPRIALEAGPDGLASLRRIFLTVRERLRPGGSLLIEHGYDQRSSIEALAESCGLECRDRLRDLAGHERALMFAPSGSHETRPGR